MLSLLPPAPFLWFKIYFPQSVAFYSYLSYNQWGVNHLV